MAQIETGVYRHPSGHTLVVNDNHPKDIGLADGYVRLGSEEEFAEGRFHPYAMPGEEAADWEPETALHGVGSAPGGATLSEGLSEDEVAELVDAAVKKALAAADKKFQAALQAQVAQAVEAATK